VSAKVGLLCLLYSFLPDKNKNPPFFHPPVHPFSAEVGHAFSRDQI
jgi:hypothetical protein